MQTNGEPIAKIKQYTQLSEKEIQQLTDNAHNQDASKVTTNLME